MDGGSFVLMAFPLCICQLTEKAPLAYRKRNGCLGAQSRWKNERRTAMKKTEDLTVTIRYNPETDQLDVTFPAELSQALLPLLFECIRAAGQSLTSHEKETRLN